MTKRCEAVEAVMELLDKAENVRASEPGKDEHAAVLDLLSAVDVLARVKVCAHPMRCADDKCHAAGHDHENYDWDGIGCEHGCSCLAVCDTGE